jgi:hypothetical protein
MTVRKSAEVNFRKAQKPQKTAILTLRKSAEVCGSRTLKPAENRAEVCGSVAEVRPPLKRATSAPPSSRFGRASTPSSFPHASPACVMANVRFHAATQGA